MAKKIALLLLVTCCMFGCVQPKNNFHTQPGCPITKTCHLTNIDSVVISGSAQVELVNGANELTITGTPEDIAISTANLQCHTLYLGTPVTCATGLRFKLAVPCLRKITVEQHASVTSNNFSSPNLTIKTKDYGAIKLEGNLGVDNIIQRGAGKIELTWINTNKLMIDSTDIGPVYLAGSANDTLIKATNCAHVDARYLRCKKLIAITANNAEAYVLPLKSFSAYAIDKSNIYYYKRPHKITILTKDSGNVLKPGWIH